MAGCPRCRSVALEEGRGSVGESSCPSCLGCYLPPESTERVVVEELGLDREVLRDIAALFSGLRLPCPGCTALMRPLRLRGVAADLCFGCGGLWLDAGELERLSGGRYVAMAGGPPTAPQAPPPVVVGRERTSAVKLGRGPFAVVFDALDDVPLVALQRAFSHTDALTDIDAQLLFRNNAGVVVEGVTRDGGEGLRALLTDEGVGSAVVDNQIFRLPPVLLSSDVEVDEEWIVARMHTGPPLRIAWETVAAVVAGVVWRERREPVGPSAPIVAFALGRAAMFAESESHELVKSEDVVVDLLKVGEPSRRLRVIPSPRPEQADVQRRLCALAVSRTAVGRGPSLPEWPRYRRVRELERELAWVAWRAARWPAS